MLPAEENVVLDDSVGSSTVDHHITARSLGLHHSYAPLTTADDLEWLFDGTFESGQELESLDYDAEAPALHMDYAQFFPVMVENTQPSNSPSQALKTTAYSGVTQDVTHSCGWRVCNAMTEARRLELLLSMRDEFDAKTLTSDIFSLRSLAAGVHFYSKYVSSEYNFHHPRVLFPEEDEQVYLLSLIHI